MLYSVVPLVFYSRLVQALNDPLHSLINCNILTGRCYVPALLGGSVKNLVK